MKLGLKSNAIVYCRNLETDSLINFINKSTNTSKFILNPNNKTIHKHPKSCPEGYELADLSNSTDWNEACQLTLKVLGHAKIVWILRGPNWRGIGNERWSLITPKSSNSCKFPPVDLKSFCVPFYHFRLSPSHNSQLEIPSLCAKNINIK